MKKCLAYLILGQLVCAIGCASFKAPAQPAVAGVVAAQAPGGLAESQVGFQPTVANARDLILQSSGSVGLSIVASSLAIGLSTVALAMARRIGPCAPR